MRNRNCFSIFYRYRYCSQERCLHFLLCWYFIRTEAEKPKIGVCFCRGRAVWDCFVFYAGKYGTEHDLCIKRWHHRCMCPVLCSRYGRILFLRMRNQACGFTSDLWSLWHAEFIFTEFFFWYRYCLYSTHPGMWYCFGIRRLQPISWFLDFQVS